MGLYERRATELLLTFPQDVLPSEEITWYLPRLTEYTKKCDALLGELVAGISSVNYKDSREEEEWTRNRDKKLGEVMKAKPELAKYSGLPSVDLLAFDARLQLEEGAFLGAIKASNVGDEVDAIAKVALHLEEKTASLEKLWKDTLDRDKDFEKKAQATAKEIAKLIAETAEKTAAANRDLIEKFAELAKINDSIPEGLPTLADALPGLFGTALAVILKTLANSALLWAKLQERLVKREIELEQLFGKEGNLIFVFSETRQEVEDFIEATNLEKAKASYAAADKELAALVSSLEVDTHQDVAGAFKKEVMEALGKVLDTAERRHNEFVKQHKAKFFGPISSQIKEELIETRQWTDLLRDYRTRPLHRQLEELYSKHLLPVTAGKLVPEARELVEKELEREFERVMKVLRELQKKLESKPPEKSIEQGRKQLAEKLK